MMLISLAIMFAWIITLWLWLRKWRKTQTQLRLATDLLFKCCGYLGTRIPMPTEIYAWQYFNGLISKKEFEEDGMQDQDADYSVDECLADCRKELQDRGLMK